MPMTTIKVDASIRDRLKVEAVRKGVTIGKLLEDLVALSEREARFAAIKEAIEATPPASIAAYEAELRHWSRLEPDATQ
ncbi:hypothetical protein [Antrihabitans cavernicola]|uniref:Uncharacterized protein n=1 Tax=Antrihabitans cavernicola TaxID=2495913 RepID=A0A5A7SBC2_9NOCA|nr:hypothetical protein [Spelaeibacter cavernicola]KAA0022452.1 hypothetical protein FOY51_12135 [Spelaeibacter cavernicola]